MMSANESKTLKAKSKFSLSKKGVHNKTSSSSGDFFVTSSEHKTSERSKKQFDKKQWRLKKYSKKYKLEQWENKRKKQALREYYKEIKDDEPKFNVQEIYEKYGDEEDENENNLNKDLSTPISDVQDSGNSATLNIPKGSKGKKNKALKKAQSHFQRIQVEKKRQKEEISQQKAERTIALNQYKAKKLEKYKKLNKKTKKGQPIMKYRMEMLLEQIQKSMS